MAMRDMYNHIIQKISRISIYVMFDELAVSNNDVLMLNNFDEGRYLSL